MTENEPSSAEPSNGESTSSDGLGADPSDAPLREQTDPAAAVAAPAVRRRWPWWAWALVFVIPFMLISGIGAALVANLLVGQATSALICYADGYCSLGAITEPTPSATGAPIDSVDPSNRVTLDGNADFDGQPVWSFTLEPTWQALAFDQDGITVFQDEATGCHLITTQGLASPDPDAPSDWERSSARLSQEIEGLAGGDPQALIINAGAGTDLAIGALDSDSTLEFASVTIEQSSPEGVSTITEIVVRTMPDSQGELIAALTCDAAALATFGSEFAFFSSALAVTVIP